MLLHVVCGEPLVLPTCENHAATQVFKVEDTATFNNVLLNAVKYNDVANGTVYLCPLPKFFHFH